MSDWLSVLQEFQVPPPAPTKAGGDIPLLEPQPKAVLFDVYGTLLCPRLGDLTDQVQRASAVDSFLATAERFGFPREVGVSWHEWFFDAIAAEHRLMREKGIEPAEVLVDQIWEELISRAGGDTSATQPRMVSIYREMLANPVRAFAGAAEAVRRLRAAGLRLGIVSNSQFYTMPILAYTLRIDPGDLFDRELTFLSFRLGFAKPAPYFFRLARTTLMHLGLKPDEALVVGNDYVNDVQPAQAQGLQALLFHGNDHTVRFGEGEQEVGVITSYEALLAACGQ
jgi:FMN phosphatase YigB (HAD superfamily)